MPDIHPQRVNPGGNLAPNEVIGRDQFIASQWRTSQRQSILLTAERRMGKTSVVKKMRAEAPAGVTAIYRSYEAVRTRQEFVEAVLTDFRSHVSRFKRAHEKLARLADDWQFALDAGPIHIAVPKPSDWKTLLQQAFDAVCDREDGLLVLFWDEVPVMLGAVAATEDPSSAQELLDVLRVVRQTHDNVRMVFTGSLGLHHVVGSIRPKKYSSAPTNDMLDVELPGLDYADAVQLGRSLLRGEKVRSTDEGIPFYIQHLVAGLRDQPHAPVADADVDAAVEAALASPIDPWEFRQYRDRIVTIQVPRAHAA